MKTIRSLLLSSTVVLAVVSGCSQTAAPLPTDPFIAVLPDGTAVTALDPARSISNQSNFYIGLNRDELGKRWFFTVYLKQLLPGGVTYGAAETMGTRVVSFKIQNDKLFVFDVSDGKATSATFDPDLVIDAFPLVHAFDGQNVAASYVIFDPAAGLDQIGLLGDAISQGFAKFVTELTYLQDFRKITDGVTYERVFMGYSDFADPTAPPQGEKNLYRLSGTLGTAFRRYSEGSGFTPLLQYATPWYFQSDPLLIPDPDHFTPRSITLADHWNIHPGMKPITWVISSRVAALAKDPVYGAYDVYGAVKRGIEGWNDAFGFKVFQTRVATPDDSFGDDDVNFLIWDADTTVGFAFADWRTNPNSGETRGASVYMNQGFLEDAVEYFPDDAASTAVTQLTARSRPATISMTWAGMKHTPLCVQWTPRFTPELVEESVLRSLNGAQASATGLTKKQKVERYVQEVVTHEVGHTLGLRHNFKGSLVPPSSSVMDYNVIDLGILVPSPQPYDIDAVRFLYGLSVNPPSEPFCTDEDTSVDPDCTRFDTGANPLTDYWQPRYDAFLFAFLLGQTDFPPNLSLNGVLQYVRAAFDPAVQEHAFRIAIDPVRTPLSPANASDPVYAPRADFMASEVLIRTYLDPDELRGLFVADPLLFDGYAVDVIGELRGELLNVDGVRSYASRRTAVDILKKLQATAAYSVLLEAQGTLQAQIRTLSGTQKVLTQDLLARISAAISPYFL